MPRIRKKTSNRGTTRDRAKVTKKVAETHRKRRKDSKTNPQWKSKQKADPGIPNSFPYKDRILAELATEKRLAEEAKLAKRQANKPAQEEEEDIPGINSVASKVLSASAAIPVKANGKAAATEDDEVPELIDTALTNLQDVLDRADVVLQVVDARDIQGGRSAFIEKLVTDAGGTYGLLVNKVDLIPREALQGWLPHLPENTYFFSSKPYSPTAAGPSTSTASAVGRAELFAAIKQWSKTKSSNGGEGDVVVAMMGLPSVGKSALVNSLLPLSAPKQAVAEATPTGAAAKHPQPTTTAPVELAIDIGNGVKARIIDTPGWEFTEDEDEIAGMDDDVDGDDQEVWDKLEDRVAGDLLRRNLGRIDRVKDALPLVQYIFKRSNAQDLMLTYNVPYFQEGDVEAFLLALARLNGRVKKHGDADFEGASRILLRDWALNTFPYYSTPPKAAAGQQVTIRDHLKSVLDKCRTRKEMRATGRGIVRFTGGEVDEREVILDDDYTALAADSDDEDDEDEDEEDLELDDELDEELLDDEDDEDEEEEDALVVGIDDGEELVLEDGDEPESGSDLPEDAEDDEAEEEDEEEEDEEDQPPAIPSALKRKRKSDVSPSSALKKAKRVSFGSNEIRHIAGRKMPKGRRGSRMRR